MAHRLDLIKILNLWRGSLLNRTGDEDQALKAESILAIALQVVHPQWPHRRCYREARMMMIHYCHRQPIVAGKEGRKINEYCPRRTGR